MNGIIAIDPTAKRILLRGILSLDWTIKPLTLAGRREDDSLD